MTPERWQRIRGVFDTAASLSGATLEDFLRRECAGDPELDAEVRCMLSEREKSGFIDRSPAAAARANAVFQPGAVVSGRYRILRALGHGGMGEVFEAEDLELHERVALKTLLPEIASDGRMIDRFKQEIQLSRKLAHPNICRVFDLARHPADGASSDTIFFLTMEYLPGETLAERLRRDTRIAPAEALELLDQMAAGLEAAHRAGVIHRDFKPSNVMLTDSAAGTRAVLMDFGLARKVDRGDESTATISGQLIGTVDYMSPELFTGGKASAASDLYALGLVAYKMVTGSFPFESDAPLAAVIRRAGQKIPSARTIVPDLDPRWDDALSRALDPDPARRFASVRDFMRALRGDTASVTVKLPVVTRRRVVVAAVAAVFAVAGAVGWQAWQVARSRPSAEAEEFYRQGVDDLHAGAYFAATRALQRAIALAPQFILAHARLAEAWLELELPDKASNEMLKARRPDLSSLARAERLQVEAIDLTITRDFPAALAKYERLMSSSGSADLLVDLGRAYEKSAKPDKATESYQRAAAGPGQHPAAWLRLAILYGRGGKAAQSDEGFARAEELYQLTSNTEGLTEIAFQRGFAATARGRYEEASGYLQKALDASRMIGNVHQEVRTLLQLATNAYAAGDASQAERQAQSALDIARSNRIESLAIRGLITLGLAYQRKRAYAGAETHFQDGLALSRSSNAQRLVAYSQLALAALHDEVSKPELALREATEAHAFYQSNGYAKEAFQCLIIVGRAHGKLGDSDSALNEFRRAVTAAEEAQDQTLINTAEESLGAAFSVLQRYPEALPHFRKELAASTKPERRGYANLHIGHTLWVLGRYDDAAAVLNAASADADAAKVLSLSLILMRDRAYMLLSQGRNAEAFNLARKAADSDTGQDPRTRSILTRIQGLSLSRSRRPADGLRHCRQSVDSLHDLNDAFEVTDARIALMEALLVAGERNEALRVFHETEATLARYPVTRWRALCLIYKADARYVVPAREALDQLRLAWGDTEFQTYIHRPDLWPLARPFLESIAANH
jgi:tetratricopeptide (TPR) repeat protein